MSNLYKRGGIWWARFQVAGKQYRRSLRTRIRSDAERRLKAVKKDAEDSILFGLAPDKTWRAAVIEWNEHATSDLSRSTYRRYLSSLKGLRAYLDDLHIREVTVQAVRDIVKRRRKEGVTTATISRDLTAMSSVLSYAIDENWIETNPTLAFRNKRFKEKREPIILPQEKDIAAAMKAAPARFADAMEWARLSGMRMEEIFGLRHDQLTSVVTIVGKRNKLRVIPYTPEMREIAERQPQYLGAPFVFYHGAGNRWTSPSSRFGDIKRRLSRKSSQFEPFRFHDLRHLYAVEYLRDGKGGLYELQQLMGHDSIKTTEIYLDYLTPEQAMKARQAIAQESSHKLRFENEKAGNNG